MREQPSAAGLIPRRTAALVIVAVVACSVYANLSFAVTNPESYRYFPPFKPAVNLNRNWELGGEYYQIAKALAAGEGFSSPFKEPTGPTAWMPPLLPALLAGLLWACDGNRDAVMAVVIFLQVCVLIGTGLLVLALARQTTSRLGTGVAAVVFVLGLLLHFRQCFQYTHDSWLVLLALDVLIAGLCWWRPLHARRRAVAWGLFGGICALINPIVGFTWGMLSLAAGRRNWFRLALAVLVAGLTLAPWTVRNYLVFGRLVPVKSNLAYELYQSQCLQPDGLIGRLAFSAHPHTTDGRERQEYKSLKEMAFLDRKRQQFRQAVAADPVNFLQRTADRFLGATLWYVPYDRTEEARRPWVLGLDRLVYPLPFLAMLVLLGTAGRERLAWAQWIVIGVYVVYLLPYVVISYYERYAVPLLGVKVLLVLWAADRLWALMQKGGRNSQR